MPTKIILATLALAIATPALAAEFYIVQDSATKRCTIVDKRPTSRTEVIVGENGRVYATREEASTAMRTVKVCESGH
jgi:exosome complex RNA-binding protein Rrp4